MGKTDIKEGGMSKRRIGKPPLSAPGEYDPDEPYRLIAERTWQAQVVEIAQRFGWACYWTWNSRHSPKGWPDLVLLKPPRMIVAELKRQDGKVTTEQARTLAMLDNCVVSTHVWRPADIDAVIAALKDSIEKEA